MSPRPLPLAVHLLLRGGAKGGGTGQERGAKRTPSSFCVSSPPLPSALFSRQARTHAQRRCCHSHSKSPCIHRLNEARSALSHKLCSKHRTQRQTVEAKGHCDDLRKVELRLQPPCL
ncbi:hypothetical protein BCV69DRAFT_280089, partial [Microstroma glucosiphilum]